MAPRNRLTLNRSQLSEFLKDFDSIRQFEQLLSSVDAVVSQPSYGDVDGGVDGVKAQLALDHLNIVSQIVDRLAMEPRVEPVLTEPELSSVLSQLQAQVADLQTQINDLRMGVQL